MNQYFPGRSSKPRTYRATWPCGGTWEFNRFDLEIPDFRDGNQTGCTTHYRSLKEARSGLVADGCKVEIVTQ